MSILESYSKLRQHFMEYNFCRIQTLRVMRAMEAKLRDRVWEIENLVALPDRAGGAVQIHSMRRRLFTILSAVSLILFIATYTLRSRSYGRFETVHRSRLIHWSELAVSSGDIYWISEEGATVERRETPLDNFPFADLPGRLFDDWAAYYLADGGFFQFPGDGRLITSERSLLPMFREHAHWHRPRSSFDFLGVNVISGTIPRRLNYRVAIVLVALVLLACLVLPVSACISFAWRRFLSHRRGSRIAQRRCAECGYDLFHTPDLCPECGTPAKSKPMPIETGNFKLTH